MKSTRCATFLRRVEKHSSQGNVGNRTVQMRPVVSEHIMQEANYSLHQSPTRSVRKTVADLETPQSAMLYIFTKSTLLTTTKLGNTSYLFQFVYEKHVVRLWLLTIEILS